MKNDPSVKNFDAGSAGLYPHLKITNEAYPRILATRKIENDSDEYFGAFLTKTATRILIDFLNKTFRIRSCDIPIDGNFSVPCTQFYHRRCLAPCVESLCTKENHDAMVELVRMFLANRRGELTEALLFRIQLASDALDFETAAYWRDILDDCNKFWSNSRWNVWIDNDVVDTFAIDDEAPDLRIYLVTQRKRYVLGRKVFSFSYPTTLDEAMRDIFDGFYQFHAPREIRITQDFEDRKKLSSELGYRFSRTIPVSVIRNSTERATTIRAAKLAKDEIELDIIKPSAPNDEISRMLRDSFELASAPKRVEAFDVAHISGTAFVSANSVWTINGFQPSEYAFRFGETHRESELNSLVNGVESRLSYPWLETPDLILLDGGKAQLNAVEKNTQAADYKNMGVISAVKPRGQHSAISYFLTRSGKKIAFDESDPSHNLLKRLRDDAHDLANRAHRDLRDMAHNYELASILPSINERERRRILQKAGSITKIHLLSDKDIHGFAKDSREANLISYDLKNFQEGNSEKVVPLIVPIRFDSENGSADDLRPIKTR
jgi:excinuclease ABC subunit C